MNISSEPRPRARALLATTVVAAAGILLSGCSLLGQVTDTVDDGDDTETGTSDNAFKLVPGDCFNDVSDADTVSTVDIVDCSVPHTREAYASIQMTEDSYPGMAETKKEADIACGDPFTDYVGLSYDQSIYDYSFYFPTQQTWDDPGLQDREILCLATADDGSLITGSVKGVGK